LWQKICKFLLALCEFLHQNLCNFHKNCGICDKKIILKGELKWDKLQQGIRTIEEMVVKHPRKPWFGVAKSRFRLRRRLLASGLFS
jgi:hypothetical protein